MCDIDKLPLIGMGYNAGPGNDFFGDYNVIISLTPIDAYREESFGTIIAKEAGKRFSEHLRDAVVLLRKTCGNTQKSRWVCRGCQYIGQCK